MSGQDVAVAASGEVISVGFFRGFTASFGSYRELTSSLGLTLVNSNPESGASFIVKASAAGTIAWGLGAPPMGNDQANGVAVDNGQGTALVTGVLNGPPSQLPIPGAAAGTSRGGLDAWLVSVYLCAGGLFWGQPAASAATSTMANATSGGWCSPCPAGYYCPGGAAKMACASGLYCPAGVAAPLSCSQGMITLVPGGACVLPPPPSHPPPPRPHRSPIPVVTPFLRRPPPPYPAKGKPHPPSPWPPRPPPPMPKPPRPYAHYTTLRTATGAYTRVTAQTTSN